MIRSAVQFDACLHQPAERIRQCRARRINDGQMIQSRAARRRWRTARALPRVQPDVMMIAARRNERRLRTKPLLQFKAQHVAIKFQRAFEVGDFQMHMADADVRIDGL